MSSITTRHQLPATAMCVCQNSGKGFQTFKEAESSVLKFTVVVHIGLANKVSIIVSLKPIILAHSAIFLSTLAAMTGNDGVKMAENMCTHCRWARTHDVSMCPTLQTTATVKIQCHKTLHRTQLHTPHAPRCEY